MVYNLTGSGQSLLQRQNITKECAFCDISVKENSGVRNRPLQIAKLQNTVTATNFNGFPDASSQT
jgi:hypothetical protein